MVERRGDLLVRFDPIELLDPTVDTKPYWGVEPLQEGLAHGSLDSLDPQPAGVNDICHDFSPETRHGPGLTRLLQFGIMTHPSASRWWGVHLVALIAGCVGSACSSATPTGPIAGDSARESTPLAERATSGELGQSEAAPDGVVRFTRIDSTVACAGATLPTAMVGLKALGFVSVINFRTAGERGETIADAREAADAAGLKYFHLPFREPSSGPVEEFLATVSEESNHPVFIHCGSANRVAMMWLIKRILVDEWSATEALAEAETVGLRSEAFRAFALDYVGSSGA